MERAALERLFKNELINLVRYASVSSSAMVSCGRIIAANGSGSGPMFSG